MRTSARRTLPVGDFSGTRMRGHRDRQRPRMSRARFAELIGVSENMVKQYETRGGRPSVNTLLLMARVLAVTPDELVRQHPDDDKEYQDGLHWHDDRRGGVQP